MAARRARWLSVWVAGAVLAGLLSTGSVATPPATAATSEDSTPLVPSQSLGTVPAQQAEEAGKALPEPNWPEAAEATVDLSQAEPGEPGTVTPQPSATPSETAEDTATEVAEVVEVAPAPEGEGAAAQLTGARLADDDTSPTPSDTAATADANAAAETVSPEATASATGGTGTDASAPPSEPASGEPASPSDDPSGPAEPDAEAVSPEQVDVRVLDREEIAAAGGVGLGVQVTRTDGVTTPGLVQVAIDYSGFEYAFGGDFASRLRLVKVPVCALQTPEAEGCTDREFVPVDNDTATGTLTATVTAEPDASGVSTQLGADSGSAFLLGTGSSSDKGDYRASTLSPTGSWEVATGSGAFSYSLPVSLPAPAMGSAPELAMTYNSQSVDGRTSASNNQASWVGMGWDLNVGFIERQYRNCTDDGLPGIADLCWDSPNTSDEPDGAVYVINLNGVSSTLVQDNTGTGSYHLQNDPGWRVQHLTGGHGADDEYWVISTQDGKRYYFGWGRSERTSAATSSVFTVPVVGNDTGEPCHAQFPVPCTQAWRWSLDRTVDANEVESVYFYDKETNYYRSVADVDQARSYTASGYLTAIEYGWPTQITGSKPTGKVELSHVGRCVERMQETDPLRDTVDACPSIKTTPGSYPDVPIDLLCDGTSADYNCAGKTYYPTFFSKDMLWDIKTSVLNTSMNGWDLVQEYQTKHALPNPAETVGKTLWLDYVQRKTYGNGTDIVLPVINFNGIDLDNKVGSTELNFRRLNTIHGDLGATTTVSYGSPNPCSADDLPTQASNTKDCFWQKWTPEGETEARSGWFKKFLVTKVAVDPTVTESQDGAPEMTTTYDYQGGAAWGFTNDPLTADEDESWSQWRGYQRVEVTSGTGAVKHSTFHWLYRGLDGDRTSKTDASATRSVKVYDGEGTAYTDSPWLQGKTIETSQRDDTGSSQQRVFHHYWDHNTAQYEGLPDARFVREDETTTLTKISTGWRTHVVQNEYDSAELASGTYGLPLRTDDQGEAGVADNRCTTYGRAYNDDLYDGTSIQRWTVLSDESRLYAAGCADRASGNQDGYTVTLFDNAADVAGNKPVDGNATETRNYASAGTTDFVKAKAGYDDAGRVIWTEDADRNRTTTTYSPANTWPVDGVTTTTPKPGNAVTDLRPALASTVWTSRFWGVPYQTKDANGQITKITLDAAGRSTEVWRPTETGSSPSLKFSYSIPTSTSNGVPDSVDGFPRVASHTLQSGTTYLSSYAYSDGLGRAREAQAPLPDNAGAPNRQVAVTRYDTSGNVTGTSAVFVNQGTAGTGGPVSPKVEDLPSYTDLTLDWAGRTTMSQILWNDGTTSRASNEGKVLTAYHGDYTTVTPAAAKPTDTYTDVYGQTSKVVEYNGASSFITLYDYTANGALSKITDSRGNITSYTYDWAGQRTRTIDPDTGRSDTAYDANGRIATVTSNYNHPLPGSSTVVTYGYDNLGRKTSVSSGSTELASWYWDGVTGGKGQVTSTTSRDTNGNLYTTKTKTFDDRGRSLSTTVSIPAAVTGLAGDHTTRYTYDAADHITSVTYPKAGGLDEETVTAAYDSYGRPQSLNSPWQSYIRDTSYDAYGLLTDRIYGPFGTGTGTDASRVSAQRSYSYYYAGGTRWLRGITTTVTSGVIATEKQQDLYTYDRDGKILNIREQASGQTAQSQCFRYDDQARLITSYTRAELSGCSTYTVSDFTGQDPYETDYNYDRMGNLQSVTEFDAARTATTRDYLYPGYDDAGTWTDNAARPHAVRKINTIAAGTTTATEDLTYDNNGQMVKHVAPGKTSDYTWNPLGRIATVKTTTSGGSELTRYAHDADGNLLVRTTPDATVASIGGMELRTTDDGETVTATRYYTSGATTVAMRTTEGTTSTDGRGKVTYLMGDTQASTQLAVDATTGATTRRRYTPFGDERNGTLPTGTDNGFLGKTEDPSTGLSLLGARAYDPELGRFLSPDPISTPYDPQNLSAYSYSGNDPINYADPSGLTQKHTSSGCDTTCDNNNNGADDGSSNDSWVEETTPSSNDGASLQDAFALLGSNQNSNAVGYWYPQVNTFGKPETVCFGRRACNKANQYLLENPDDVAGAKQIAANYCLIHMAECAKDARIWERTNELGEEFVMAMGVGTGRLIGGRLPKSLKSGTCTKCFLAGTDVLMADGTTKDIEDIEPGDKVQATDPETGETGPRKVTRLIITKDDKHFNELSIATDDGIEKLTATYEHPFWSPSEDDWIEAGDLSPGMTLLTADGTTVIVTANRSYTKHATTYNLTVDDLHTYYVLAGDTPVLVHNSGCPTFNFDVAPKFRGIYIITMKDGRAYVGSAGKLPTSTVHTRLHKAFTDEKAAVYRAGYTYDDVEFVATRDMSGKSWAEIRQAEQAAIDGLGGVGGGTLLNRRNEH